MKLSRTILIVIGLLISVVGQAKQGDLIECRGERFTVLGTLNDTMMGLEIADQLGLVTIDAGLSENFEFHSSTNFEDTFESGKTFEAFTADYTLVINLPVRVFQNNIKSAFNAQFVTYFEGFNPSAKEELECRKID